ncbi:MAG: hypothetical protein BWX70_03313 [Verrucomicrobia bacterium ADurb.Bin070]|nr:MAG: hypothetical protein BWX70_03313 [Verrucomicrobia bacterium ADurb.Bin070]
MMDRLRRQHAVVEAEHPLVHAPGGLHDHADGRTFGVLRNRQAFGERVILQAARDREGRACVTVALPERLRDIGHLPVARGQALRRQKIAQRARHRPTAEHREMSGERIAACRIFFPGPRARMLQDRHAERGAHLNPADARQHDLQHRVGRRAPGVGRDHLVDVCLPDGARFRRRLDPDQIQAADGLAVRQAECPVAVAPAVGGQMHDGVMVAGDHVRGGVRQRAQPERDAVHALLAQRPRQQRKGRRTPLVRVKRPAVLHAARRQERPLLGRHARVLRESRTRVRIVVVAAELPQPLVLQGRAPRLGQARRNRARHHVMTAAPAAGEPRHAHPAGCDPPQTLHPALRFRIERTATFQTARASAPPVARPGF